MATANRIKVDVYVTPLLRLASQTANERKQWWSPTSVTLIHTPNEAIVIDTSPTVAQTQQIANWIDETIIPGCKVKYFWTTHAHGDHFLGFPVFQKRYPGIKPLATEKVLQGLKKIWQPDQKKRWGNMFAEEVIMDEIDFSTIDPEGLQLDGHVIKAYDVVQGDSAANSFLHIPTLSLIVAGDLVYGDCHQYLAEANTREKRKNWIKAVEFIESFKPQIVVGGHVRKSQVLGAYLMGHTKEYIRVFGEELEKAEGPEELEKKMKELYPERWNDMILELGCKASFAARES